MLVKTSETGCFLVALFFLNFFSLRTDSSLDNIAPRHICVLKALFVKAAVVIVLWLVSHWQQALEPWMCYCQLVSVRFVYLTVQELRVSYTLPGTFLVKLFWWLNYCLKWLFCPHLTSLVQSKYRPRVKQNSLKWPVNIFFLSVVSWSCYSKDDCCRLGRICVQKKICTFVDTHSSKAKASARRSAGLSSGNASAFTERCL